jgi:hypothetical protein
MSASNEWTEWHLTPRGWEEGDTKKDFVGTKTTPTPKDRVLTFRYKEFLSSVYSKPDIGKTMIWRCNDEQLIKNLLDKFGECPNYL